MPYIGYPVISSDVILMLHFEEDDDSTTLVDSSSYNRTGSFTGNSNVSTTSPMYGSGSLLLDTTGEYITVNYATCMDWGTGDFCLEGFCEFSSLTNGGIFHLHPSLPSNSLDGLAIGYDGTQLQIYLNNTNYTRTWSPSTGVKYHWCMERVSGSVTVYIDGTAMGASISYTVLVGTNNAYIGLYYSTSFTFNGKIDEVRFWKKSVYGGNFTPPTPPLSNT